MIVEALLCLALNVYHEARDQSIEGQEAVAAVTMERADQKAENVCTEVFRPKQFSWANSLTSVSKTERAKRAKNYLPKDKKAWEQAKKIAQSALDGTLKSAAAGAFFFYNPKIADPVQVKMLRKNTIVVAKIDDHVFLKYRSPIRT